ASDLANRCIVLSSAGHRDAPGRILGRRGRPATGKCRAPDHDARSAREAARHRPFLVMSGAYFVCGLNLVFLATHLPTYLAICGQDPMLSAEALAVIGGMNCVGSLAAGWLGGRYPKHILLGLLYILRAF